MFSFGYAASKMANFGNLSIAHTEILNAIGLSWASFDAFVFVLELC